MAAGKEFAGFLKDYSNHRVGRIYHGQEHRDVERFGDLVVGTNIAQPLDLARRSRIWAALQPLLLNGLVNKGTADVGFVAACI
jgi:hypothetical protein